jgi:ribonucleoside-triphosphate reductase (thioredoxin)
MSVYEDYIAISRYARYLPDKKRRETWDETVDRYCDYMGNKFSVELSGIRELIKDKEVMPSMRALMTAGPALERDNICGYNCAYIAVDNIRVFGESLYIQMNGTGLGFSVERQHIHKLPEVAEEFHDTDTIIGVRDSKLGWATALDEYVRLLYSGKVPKVDMSKVRPAGSPLKTFGGRASGGEPFAKSLLNITGVFRGAAGRKLNSIELHDVMCYIGECVVVGGVRRTAMINLSNHSDERMRHAKMGNWFVENPQRSLANNSICYTEKPDVGAFMREWNSIYESRSGERGIFNRQACKDMAPERRDTDHEFGTNPCSEIVLRSAQFCNLTEVVVRPEDNLDMLKVKVEAATILGTLQSALTDFRFLRKVWKNNCEEERLLGVSLTGIWDSEFFKARFHGDAERLKEHAIKVNKEWAKRLGINPSTSITCVKPSGTVSQLVDSASGCHPRHSRWYLRRVRNDIKDPLAQVMIDAGVPYEVDKFNKETYVFEFPIASPITSTTRHDITPFDQLEMWKSLSLHWCEHKPSMTCYIPEDQWPQVGAWIWENWDAVNGISFLPSADEGHVYEQAPYEDITEEEYEAREKLMPDYINWSFEEDMDNTTASQEVACSAGVCEI